MSVPTPHAPDEEWAEERVRRMMEPEQAAKIPKPGDEFSATEAPDGESGAAMTPEVELASSPSSDDDVDELINAKPVEKTEAEAAEPNTLVADPETDKAVEDITKTDGDEVLEAQDTLAQKDVVMKPKLWERFKNDWGDWWDNPRKRYATIATIVLLLAIIFTFPASRAYMLNLVGVRSTITVTVLDGTTNLPLKGATVTVAGVSGQSSTNGTVSLSGVKLGTQTATITKSAFATATLQPNIKTGTTALGSVALKAVGTQFSFVFTDYVSGKTVTTAEVSSGQANAQSNKNGKAILTVAPSEKTSLTASVTAKGYRTEQVTIDTTAPAKPYNVQLVTATKEVFVSKQSGSYDLYTEDVDGKNRNTILTGTGTETQNIALSVSPDGTKAVLVSTRDNQHDSQGYLLSTITTVDVATGKSTAIDHADGVQLLGWSGSKVVFEETVASASAANPNRQRIFSYDTATNKKVQLAAANYFNGTALVGDAVYYIVASSDPGVTDSFSKISVDATAKQTIASQEIWSLTRTGYNSFALETPTGWQAYTVGASTLKTGTAPSTYASREYTDNSDSSQSLWVDIRDGKGVLLTYDTKGAKDTVIASQAGLTNPVRWLDSTSAVVRVVTPSETADYVVNLAANAVPKKITDVTATN